MTHAGVASLILSPCHPCLVTPEPAREPALSEQWTALRDRLRCPAFELGDGPSGHNEATGSALPVKGPSRVAWACHRTTYLRALLFSPFQLPYLSPPEWLAEDW